MVPGILKPGDSVLICRVCNQQKLDPILNLGRTPLANSILPKEEIYQPQPIYPLELLFCPHCSLVQTSVTIPPEDIFLVYPYLSSTSPTMLKHSHKLAQELIVSRKLGEKSLVVEIASNDGYLLQYYLQEGIQVLGIEPATNIAPIAIDKGIPTLCSFFNLEMGRRLKSERIHADVIHIHNVLAHVPDPVDFVKGLAQILRAGGMIVVDVPYLKDLIDQVEFDTIYHEHLCYFSLSSLQYLFSSCGLKIVDLQRLDIHGGSLRLFVQAEGFSSSRVTDLVLEENVWGSRFLEGYKDFAKKVENLKQELIDLLWSLKDSRKTIVAYGASAKGSTLLNYCHIGIETLDYVVDKNLLKQGKYTPGSKLLIRSPEILLEEKPDYVLLLTWNFAEEILEQQKEYLELGGKLIIPIPRLKIVDKDWRTYEIHPDQAGRSLPN